jgi:aryl-alcohol dehydrogenase-like predicted oxidoreductase
MKQRTLAGRSVSAIGLGGMPMSIEGRPDRPRSIATIHAALDAGITLIDTADAYHWHGDEVGHNESLIAEALKSYGGSTDDVVVATKGGLVRYGKANGPWPIVGVPDYLRQCVQMSLRRLKVEQIDLWQLLRIDPKVPRDEQFGVIRECLDQGLNRFAGLSMVTIEEIEAARKIFPVATVQNRFSLSERSYDSVVDYCEREGIGFIPYAPLAAGGLAKPGSLVDELARAKGATPGQIALAWVLRRSPVMLPIFGTSRVAHLEDNVAAAAVILSDDDYARLDSASKAEAGIAV